MSRSLSVGVKVSLPKILVALVLEVGHLAVGVGEVVAASGGPVVGGVEEELVLHCRAADVEHRPVPVLVELRQATGVQIAGHAVALELVAEHAPQLLLPDLDTVLMVKPPERLKSSAVAPPLTTATWSMSCEEGSAARVPKSGRLTLTPSNW